MIKSVCTAFLAMSALPALAVDKVGANEGIHFTHKDWELACDNTRTCRAAGYQVEDGRSPAVSVLLERKAGPGQPVTGQVQIGSYDEDAPVPKSNVLAMSIDRKAQGDVKLDPETLTARLDGAQVEALVRALAKDGVAQWTDGHQAWTVSGKGATAVLLKMDEYQHRIGTHGAVLRRGTAGEGKVAPAVPVPVIKAAAAGATEVALAPGARAALAREIQGTFGKDDCDDFAAGQLTALRLTPTRLLVQVPCWRGAYNAGSGYWVANQAASYAPVLVTFSGSDYDKGVLTAAHKGRGLGDCWGREEWTWDGRRFMLTAAATTGMCRLVAAGGAWDLPTYVAKVVRAAK